MIWPKSWAMRVVAVVSHSQCSPSYLQKYVFRLPSDNNVQGLEVNCTSHRVNKILHIYFMEYSV